MYIYVYKYRTANKKVGGGEGEILVEHGWLTETSDAIVRVPNVDFDDRFSRPLEDFLPF